MKTSDRSISEIKKGGVFYNKSVQPPTSNPQIPMRYQSLCRGGKSRRCRGGILKKQEGGDLNYSGILYPPKLDNIDSQATYYRTPRYDKEYKGEEEDIVMRKLPNGSTQAVGKITGKVYDEAAASGAIEYSPIDPVLMATGVGASVRAGQALLPAIADEITMGTRQLPKLVKSAKDLPFYDYDPTKAIKEAIEIGNRRQKMSYEVGKAGREYLELLGSKQGQKRIKDFDAYYGTDIGREADNFINMHGEGYNAFDNIGLPNNKKLRVRVQESSDWLDTPSYGDYRGTSIEMNNPGSDYRIDGRSFEDFKNLIFGRSKHDINIYRDNIENITDPNTAAYFSPRRVLRHELKHGLNRGGERLSDKYIDELDEIFYRGEDLVKRHPDITLGEADYLTNPTEIESWVNTDLRDILVQKGYLEDHFDKLTPKKYIAFIENEATNLANMGNNMHHLFVNVKDANKFIDFFNRGIPAAAGVVYGAKEYNNKK